VGGRETTREELEGDSNNDYDNDREPESLCESCPVQPIADVIVIPSLDTLHDYMVGYTNRSQVANTWECKENQRQVEVLSHELAI
jgi:hypothetical protein